MTLRYLDIQGSGGSLLPDNPAAQSFRISNLTAHTVIATVSLPLATNETSRSYTASADSGVTGSSSSTGALTQTLTLPSKKGVTYAVSSVPTDPAQDQQSDDLVSATTTPILTVTATTYNGVGLSPQVAYVVPLATIVIGDTDNVLFGDNVTRDYDSNAVALQFFRARTKSEAQQMLDWFESGHRNLKDFMDLYAWAIAQGFTGI